MTDDFSDIDRALHRVSASGAGHARLANATRIRRLAGARRRRRVATVGAAGALTAAGAVSVVAAFAPSSFGTREPRTAAGSESPGVAYRVVLAGVGYGEHGDRLYDSLMLLDSDDGCGSMPITTVRPPAGFPLPTPTLSPSQAATLGPSNGLCDVILALSTGALVTDPDDAIGSATGPCVTWPAPPAGYTPATSAPAGECPNGARKVDKGINIGWLLIKDGKASFVVVQPAK